MVTLLLEVKTPNHKVIRRLTIACEVLKRKLSAENTVESKIELDTFLPDGGDLILSMSKAKLEHLCEPLFKETMEHVKSAKLAKIHLNKEIFTLEKSVHLGQSGAPLDYSVCNWASKGVFYGILRFFII